MHPQLSKHTNYICKHHFIFYIKNYYILHIKQRRYTVALSTLKSRELALGKKSYLPEGFEPTLDGITLNKEFKFSQFTHVIDQLLQKRLLSLSHTSSSFMSAIVEQQRITLHKEHKVQDKELASIVTEIDQIRHALDATAEHDPELAYIYM